jgi:hypothetical protein
MRMNLPNVSPSRRPALSSFEAMASKSNIMTKVRGHDSTPAPCDTSHGWVDPFVAYCRIYNMDLEWLQSIHAVHFRF